MPNRERVRSERMTEYLRIQKEKEKVKFGLLNIDKVNTMRQDKK